MKILFWLVFMLLLAMGNFANASSTSQQELTCGSHKIVMLSAKAAEDAAMRIQIIDEDGKSAFPTIAMSGAILSLCKQHKIVLLDTSIHYEPGPSFILGEDGRLIFRGFFGEIDSYGKSDDDKIFWIQSKNAVDKKPTVDVQVYSYRGERLSTRTFAEQTTMSVDYQGKKYNIDVIQPDIPG